MHAAAFIFFFHMTSSREGSDLCQGSLSASFGQESEKTVQKKEESPEPLRNRTGLERSVLAETKPRAKKVQKHIVCSGSAYFPIIYGYKWEGFLHGITQVSSGKPSFWWPHVLS
jgi:hypothetical protein